MPDSENPRRALEALIFASDGPATASQIRRALHSLAPGRIPDLVSEINEELEKDGRPYWIVEVAGGYQFRTRPEYADVIRAAQPERKVRLSRAALETLAMIAYRQPLTRAEIEDLRCVDCGAILKSLLERSLIRIVGRRDAPGRPVLYGTSTQFLETFSLKSLRDLPTLRDVELDEATTGDPGPASDERRVVEDPDVAALPPADSEDAEPDDGTELDEPRRELA